MRQIYSKKHFSLTSEEDPIRVETCNAFLNKFVSKFFFTPKNFFFILFNLWMPNKVKFQHLDYEEKGIQPTDIIVIWKVILQNNCKIIEIQTFLKNWDPPLGFSNSQIEIGNFRLFLLPFLPLGICPKFSRFYIVMPPLIKWYGKNRNFGWLIKCHTDTYRLKTLNFATFCLQLRPYKDTFKKPQSNVFIYHRRFFSEASWFW